MAPMSPKPKLSVIPTTWMVRHAYNLKAALSPGELQSNAGTPPSNGLEAEGGPSGMAHVQRG